ncbi:MAG: tetratricopeptide repeat protein [Clostridiales bacterium]|nr:tetratricopeptide repeat protein [Clostridiales bacterium]
MADDCVRLRSEARPEIVQLNEIYDSLRQKAGGLSKKAADALLYQRMYGAPPRSDSDILKIRFWRTGRHAPHRRDECIAFGRALGLEEEELTRFLLRYYDRADQVFETEPEARSRQAGCYLRRLALLSDVAGEYMRRLHPMRRRLLEIPLSDRNRYLRHAYYLDACRFTPGDVPILPHRHVETVSYDAEFSRQMKLLGEIPRRVMIRHLFLLTQPYISVQRMNELLSGLGYLPLTESHTMVSGERLDRLLLAFLSLYEEQCRDCDPSDCTRWLISAYHCLDCRLKEMDNRALRFLYFKSLGSSASTEMESRGRVTKAAGMDRELLEWERLQFDLRSRYTGTPPGFRDAEQREEVERRLEQMAAKYEQEHTFRLLSHCIPGKEPFVGREALLEEIGRRFAPEGGGRTVVLYGIGGMGKSTLARAYMRRYARRYDAMLFLPAGKGIRSAINDDSQVTISNLQYSRDAIGSRARYFEKKMSVLGNVASESRLLIVIDDLNVKSDQDMRRLFSLPCHILVTARINPTLWGVRDGLCVGCLSDPKEQEDFLRLYIGRPPSGEERSALQKYSDLLGGHTLLMKLAASSVRTTGLPTVSQSPGIYPAQSASREEPTLSHTVFMDIFSRFTLSQAEKQAMRELSILPTQGIALDFYKALSGVTEETISSLNALMLVNIDDNGIVSLHPLIAAAARQVFSPTLSNCRRLVENFCKSLFHMWDQTYRENQEMESYVFALLSAFPHPTPGMARHLEQLATWLWVQEYYQEAEQYCARIVACVERRYGLSHQLTGEMYLRMAAVYHNGLKYDEAGVWYQKGLDALRSCAPADRQYYQLLSTAYEKVAREELRAGDLEQALAHIRQALSLEQKYQALCRQEQNTTDAYSLGAETEIQYILCYESQILYQMGRYEEGEAICRSARDCIQQLFPDAFRLNEFDLALIDFLTVRGDLVQAETLGLECVRRATYYRGLHFKDTLESMEKMGDIYTAQGNVSEAYKVYTELYSELVSHFPFQEQWISRVLDKSSRLE